MAVVFVDLFLHALDCDEDGGEEEVGHDDRPEVDLCEVVAIVSLRSIAECEDETCYEDGEV